MKKALLLIAAMAIVVMCSKEDYQERVFPTAEDTFYEVGELENDSANSGKTTTPNFVDPRWEVIDKSTIHADGEYNLYHAERGVVASKSRPVRPGRNYVFFSNDHYVLGVKPSVGKWFGWIKTDDYYYRQGKSSYKVNDAIQALTSGDYSEDHYKALNPDSPFTDFYWQFVEDYREVTGNELPEQKSVEIYFEEGPKWKVGGARGRCNDTLVDININSKNYQSFQDFYGFRQSLKLLYHELGHDVLNYKHQTFKVGNPDLMTFIYDTSISEMGTVVGMIEKAFETENDGIQLCDHPLN